MADLTDLNPCPLCGSAEGYKLLEGSTFRSWQVVCAACGERVTECRSDPGVRWGHVPSSHPHADAAWQEATKHYAALLAQVAALQAERDAERERADMHADLGRRTAAALRITGDRSGMPETAVALQAEVSRLAELHGLYQDKAQRLQAENDRLREREKAACHLAEVAMGDAARVAAERDALRALLDRVVTNVGRTMSPDLRADIDAAIDAARGAEGTAR